MLQKGFGLRGMQSGSVGDGSVPILWADFSRWFSPEHHSYSFSLGFQTLKGMWVSNTHTQTVKQRKTCQARVRVAEHCPIKI